MDLKSFELGLVVMWATWNSRNALVINGETRESKGTADFAMSLFNEYQPQNNRETPIFRVPQRWQAPPPEFIKLILMVLIWLNLREVLDL